jgi:PhzF family phenazine biosynthesis protein
MKVFIVDAFTDQPFKGNPAGVCLHENEIPVEIMQSIAHELNLSETAFLQQVDFSGTNYSVRYFTPTVEIDFCGHATLASAKVIFHTSKKDEVSFTTFQHLKLHATNLGTSIKMKFPLYGIEDFAPSKTLLDAFGIVNPVAVTFANNLDMLIVEVADKTALVNISPDFTKAIQTPDGIKELVVTAKSDDSDFDFYSRCFCPWIGINEDPVTGASHTVLAKYWSKILRKTEMKAFQASRRGGHLNLKIISDTELEVISNAIIVFEGEMYF